MNIDIKARELVLKNKPIKRSLNKLGELVVEGIKNRLKKGIVKTVKYSMNKLTDTILKNVNSMCTRSHLNARARQLTMTDYFINHIQTQLSDDKLNETRPMSEHLKHLQDEVKGWHSLGAVTKLDAYSMSDCLKEMVDRFNDSELHFQYKGSFNPAKALADSGEKINNSESLGAVIDSIKSELDKTGMKYHDDKLFIMFVKTFARKKFEDFEHFFNQFGIFLKSYRDDEHSSADQTNRLINSARKLYLSKLIDKNHFSYSTMKKGILEDLNKHKNLKLYWNIFENIVSKNIREYKKNKINKKHTKESKIEEVKTLFESVQQNLHEASSLGLIPKKFVSIHFENLKKETFDELKAKILHTKNIAKIKSLNVEKTLGDAGRMLKNVDTQSKSYNNVLLTNLLDASKSLNARYLKRCKKLFSKRRSMAMFTKEGFYLIIIKMFFESNKDFKFQGMKLFVSKMMEYLETLEYFKYITIEERTKIVYHVISLITPFINDQSHTFELDKFYAYYKMIINPEEPIDFSGEKVYEDWPDQILLNIAKHYKQKLSSKEFKQLEVIIKKYKDSRIKVKKPDVQRFIQKHDLTNKHKMAAYLIKQIQIVLRRVVDSKIVPTELTKVLVKTLIAMFVPNQSQSRLGVHNILIRLLDNNVEVKARPQLKFLIKRMIMMDKLAIMGFKTRKELKLFGVRMIDNLIIPEIPNIKFLQKGDFMWKASFRTYIGSKIMAMMKVVKDMKITPEKQLKFLLANVLRLSMSALTNKKMNIQMEFKRVLDNLVIPQTPYTKFILKTLISFGAIANLLSYAKKEVSFYTNRFIDSLIIVESPVIKFLVTSKKFTKHQMEAYRKNQFTLMAKKIQDAMIHIQSTGNFLIKTLKKTKPNFIFHSHAKFRTFLRKIVDQIIHVKPALIKVLIKSLTKFVKPLFAAQKEVQLKMILAKFQDHLIRVEDQTKFLVKSLLRLMGKTEVYTKKQLTLFLKKFRDQYIHVDPGIIKFLTKSTLKIQKSLSAVNKKFTYSFFHKKFVDSFIHVEPAMVKFLLRGEVLKKKESMAMVKKQMKLFFEKYNDLHVPVPDKEKFLMFAILEMCRTFQFGSTKKLKFFLKKFKDEFVAPKSILSFLLTAIKKVGSAAIYAKRRTMLTTFLKKVKDEFIRVEPGFVKFLLHAESRFKGRIFAQKLTKFKAFWTGAQDFLVSPLSWDKFLLTNLMFSNKQFNTEKIARMKTLNKKLQDFFVYVEPGMVKFLLTAYKTFMSKMEFMNKQKLKFYLEKFVDALNVPVDHQKFLLTAFMNLSSKFLSTSQNGFKFHMQKFNDYYVSVDIPGKALYKSLFTKKQMDSMTKIIKLKSFWKKYQDFFISPMTWDKFLIYSALFTNLKMSTIQKREFKVFMEKLRDFHVLVDANMPKFLVQSLYMFINEMNFFSKSKLKFVLRKFVDNMNFPQELRKFLLQSFLQILQKVSMVKKTQLKINYKKLWDFYIKVEPPGKFLIRSELDQNMHIMKKSLTEIRAFWMKMHDFLVSPLSPEKFLLTNLLLGKGMTDMQRKTQLKLMEKKLVDFHNLVEPNFVKFIVASMIKVLSRFSFSSKSKLKFFLRKLVDQFILTDSEQKFLVSSFMGLLSPAFSTYGKLDFKLMYSQYLDNYIAIPGQNFLIKHQNEFKKYETSIRKVVNLQTKFEKLQDFFISPLNMQQYLIMSVIMNSSTTSAQRLMKIKSFHQKMQDFFILAQPGFIKFLLQSLIEMGTDLQFHSEYKLKFWLQKFVDEFVQPVIPGKFLLTALMKILKPAFAVNQKINLKLALKKYIDYMIPVEIPGKFLINAEVKMSLKEMQQKVTHLSRFWEKFNDFLVTPQRLDKFLLKALVFTSTEDNMFKKDILKIFAVKMQDYHVFAQPNFVKFILSSYLSLLRHIAFSSKSKLTFFLKKFVDAFIIPEGPAKFLLKSLFEMSLSGFHAYKKVQIKGWLQKFADMYIPVEVPGKFLLTDESRYNISTVQANKVARMKTKMMKMRDFFISPLSMDKFVIFSLLFNKSDPAMKQASKLSIFHEKMQDFHVLVDLGMRKFLITSLLQMFSKLRFSSTRKLHFMLEKFVDSFNLPEVPGKFLLNSLFQLMTVGFSAYQKYRFSAEFRKMVDFFIEPQINGKFLIRAETDSNVKEIFNKVTNFHLFLNKVQDYLVIPMTEDFMLYSLIVFKGMAPNSATYKRFFTQLKAIQDYHILVEPGFVMFLLHALTEVSQNIHFLRMSKVKFFLRKVVDQFISVEPVQKFLINYFAALITPAFAARKTLNLKVVFSKMTDMKIDPLVPDKFLIKDEMFNKMEAMYAAKITRLKGFFTKLQDFFIQPITFEKFLLQSILELKMNDLSFVKIISPKTYFKIFQDYHNVVEPNTVMFIMHNLMSLSKNITFRKTSQLKTFLSKYLDNYIEVVTGIKFLLNALMNFFGENFQVTKTKLSIMCKKYIDSYIEVEPQMKFLIKLTSQIDLTMAQRSKIGLTFLLKKMKDEKNEIQRQDQFYMTNYLQRHGIDQVTFQSKLKLFEQKMRDFFIEVQGQAFLIKSLLEGKRTIEVGKVTQLKTFMHKLKDEYVQATPYMVIFMLKNVLSFFGDMEFKSTRQLKRFLKQYVDLYYDVLARNTLSVIYKMFQNGASLVNRRMNFTALFKRLKMGWLYRQIRGVNVHNQSSVYHQFLQFFNLDNNVEMSKSKMGFLMRAIRGINISNIVKNNKTFTQEQARNFYKRMFNFRLGFVRRGFGFNIINKSKLKIDMPTLMEQTGKAGFFKNKLKHFFKIVIRDINKHTSRKELARESYQGLNTLMGRTHMKMYAKAGIFKGDYGRDTDEKETHSFRDMMSKTLIKTLTHQATEDMQSQHKDFKDLFKSKHETMDSLDKIYFKTLNVIQGSSVESDSKALHTISKSLNRMQNDLKKVMLKELKFEDRPAMPKQDSIMMKKGMISQTLREMDNKVKGIGKVLLNFHKLGKKSNRLKNIMEYLPAIMEDIKKNEKFVGFKKLLLKRVKSKKLSKNKKFHAMTDQINAWLARSKDYDPTQFMKILLFGAAGPGNKMTDKETRNFFLHLQEMVKDVVHKKEMLFEPTSKALLLSAAKPGNKMTDTEYILKRLMGSVVESYIEKKRALTPFEFGKVLLKNVGYRRKYHPLFKKAILQKMEDKYDLIRKSLNNLPVPQAKIMLISFMGPGNKITDVLPKQYQMNSLVKAQQAFHTFKMTLETAKRIYLKGTCMCCCEYYIISNFEECQSYEETGEDYVLDKALHEMEIEGDRFSDYDKFDAIVKQIESQDFRCESGPRNMFYNILPSVKITLGVKKFPGAIELPGPQELTETKDIHKIVGSSQEMYDIDTDFIDKMVQTNMEMDPKNITKKRKNNYFETPEYKNSSKMIDFLDRVYNIDPNPTNNFGTLKDPLDDVDDMRGKDFHEEHEMTRNQRLNNYSLDAEKISSDKYYERLLRERKSHVQKIKLDSVGLLDLEPIDAKEMEETIDKL
jgi:hypothetical protein